MSERLIDDAVHRALVERGEEVTYDAYATEMSAQAAKQEPEEITYEPDGVAIDVLARKILREQGKEADHSAEDYLAAARSAKRQLSGRVSAT